MRMTSVGNGFDHGVPAAPDRRRYTWFWIGVFSLALAAVLFFDRVYASMHNDTVARVFCDEVPTLPLAHDGPSAADSGSASCVTESGVRRCDVRLGDIEVTLDSAFYHYEIYSPDNPTSYVRVRVGDSEWRGRPRDLGRNTIGDRVALRDDVLCGSFEQTPFVLDLEGLRSKPERELVRGRWGQTLWGVFRSLQGGLMFFFLLLSLVSLFAHRALR